MILSMEGKDDPQLSDRSRLDEMERALGRHTIKSFGDIQSTVIETERAGQQEGNYASSAHLASGAFCDYLRFPPHRLVDSPSLSKGRMYHYDLGLTLLPGLQVEQVETKRNKCDDRGSSASVEASIGFEVNVGGKEIEVHDSSGLSKSVAQDGEQVDIEASAQSCHSLKDAESCMIPLQEARNASSDGDRGVGRELGTARLNDAQDGLEDSDSNGCSASFKRCLPRVGKRKRDQLDVDGSSTVCVTTCRTCLNLISELIDLPAVRGGTRSHRRSSPAIPPLIGSSQLADALSGGDVQHLQISHKTRLVLQIFPKLIHLFNPPPPSCKLHVESIPPSILPLGLTKLIAQELLLSQHSSDLRAIFTKLAKDLVSSTTASPDFSNCWTQELQPLNTTPELGSPTPQNLSTLSVTATMGRRQIGVYGAPAKQGAAPRVDSAQNANPRQNVNKPREEFLDFTFGGHNVSLPGAASPMAMAQYNPTSFEPSHQNFEHPNMPIGHDNTQLSHLPTLASRNSLDSSLVQTSPQPRFSPPQPQATAANPQHGLSPRPEYPALEQFISTQPAAPISQVQHGRNISQHGDAQALVNRMIAENQILMRENMSLKLSIEVRNKSSNDSHGQVRVEELKNGYQALHDGYTKQTKDIMAKDAQLVELHGKYTELKEAHDEIRKKFIEREKKFQDHLKSLNIEKYAINAVTSFQNPADSQAYAMQPLQEQIGTMKKAAGDSLNDLNRRPPPPVMTAQTLIGRAGYTGLAQAIQPNGGPYNSPYQTPRKVSGAKRPAPQAKSANPKKRRSTASKSVASAASAEFLNTNTATTESNPAISPATQAQTGNDAIWIEDVPMLTSENAQFSAPTFTQGNASAISTGPSFGAHGPEYHPQSVSPAIPSESDKTHATPLPQAPIDKPENVTAMGQNLSSSHLTTAKVDEAVKTSPYALYFTYAAQTFGKDFVESISGAPSSTTEKQATDGPSVSPHENSSGDINTDTAPARTDETPKSTPAKAVEAPEPTDNTSSGDIAVNTASATNTAAAKSPLSADSGYGPSPNTPTFPNLTYRGIPLQEDDASQIGPLLSPGIMRELFEGTGHDETREEQELQAATWAAIEEMRSTSCELHDMPNCHQCRTKTDNVPNNPPMPWEGVSSSTAWMDNEPKIFTDNSPFRFDSAQGIKEPAIEPTASFTANTTLTQESPESRIDRILADLPGRDFNAPSASEDLSNEWLGSNACMEELLEMANADNIDHSVYLKDTDFEFGGENFNFGTDFETFSSEFNWDA